MAYLFTEMDSDVTADVTETEPTTLQNAGDITENETSLNRYHYSCG